MRQPLASMIALLLPLAAVGSEPALVGTAYTVNDGSGNQTDPHVSGELVAYTNEDLGSSEIRYHDLSTGADQAIPRGASDYDFLSDISGPRIVFTRFGGEGSGIHLFDIGAGTTVALDPVPNPARVGAAIGGGTVAWVDQAFTGSAAQSEIVAHELATSTSTRLSHDLLLDYAPAVSPSGEVIVWTKCQSNNTGCTLHLAVLGAGGWTTSQIPTPAGSDDRLADTDGLLVAYESTRLVGGVPETDISWQPVAGGAEQQIPLSGDQRNPAISGGLIAFESRPSSATTNYDILLYDTRTSLLYQVTSSPDSETLTDIDVSPDGLVRVAYVRTVAGDNNVYAFSFRVREPAGECEAPAPQSPEDACSDPGDRPLLAAVSLTRETGKPQTGSASFSAAAGEGLLCIENGAPTGKRATAGWVKLDGSPVVEPDAFQKDVGLIARTVQLSGDHSIHARIAGTPYSSYTVRLYGAAEAPCTGASSARSLRLRSTELASISVVEGARVPTRDSQPPEVMPLTPISDEPQAGCSSSGSGFAFSALVLLSLVLFRRTGGSLFRS